MNIITKDSDYIYNVFLSGLDIVQRLTFWRPLQKSTVLNFLTRLLKLGHDTKYISKNNNLYKKVFKIKPT